MVESTPNTVFFQRNENFAYNNNIYRSDVYVTVTMVLIQSLYNIFYYKTYKVTVKAYMFSKGGKSFLSGCVFFSYIHLTFLR